MSEQKFKVGDVVEIYIPRIGFNAIKETGIINLVFNDEFSYVNVGTDIWKVTNCFLKKIETPSWDDSVEITTGVTEQLDDYIPPKETYRFECAQDDSGNYTIKEFRIPSDECDLESVVGEFRNFLRACGYADDYIDEVFENQIGEVV